MFPLPIIWTVDLGYDSLLVLATGFCWLLVCWLSFYIAFWVLIEICWQSTSSYFLERVKCAHSTPQIKVDLFSVLTATFMKSCHHHLFNLCTIQRYLTVVTAKVLAHALVIPWLYHLETPGCPSHFSARTGLPKHYVLFQGFFFFSFSVSFMLTCYLVSFIASLYLKIIIIFLKVLLVGSSLYQDCHISGRHQILVWCSDIFLINPSVLFPLPSMTFSVDIILGLIAPGNGRSWIWWH